MKLATRWMWTAVLCLGASALAEVPSATTETVIPPAPTHYMGREIAQTMHYTGAPWLIRDSRAKEESTQRFLQQLQVEPGSTVCDMGCGNGYYTLPLARMTGEEGRVIGVDIQPEMLEMLKERAGEWGVENIETVVGTAVDPGLEPNSIDLMILVDVYHEFSHPEQMLEKIRESLKPDGEIALLEFRAEDPEVPIKPEHKMSKEQIYKEFAANGFAVVREYDDLPWQHLLFLRKTPDEAVPEGE